MKKSLANSRFEEAKSRAKLDEDRECQIEGHDYTKTPISPKVPQIKVKRGITGWLVFAKNTLSELKP